MRLWHQKLIPYLDRQRLLGQLLAIFPTAISAYREFCPEAKTDKAIYRVLNGQRNTYKGFIYKRISKEEEQKLNGLLRFSDKTE